jgi:hypothetical protein
MNSSPTTMTAFESDELVVNATLDPVSDCCQHVGLKTFTFADGKIIKCCPTCNVFDKHRREVLCPSKGGARG